MVVARVILKGARSYRLGGRRFIKDVPQVIKGDEVEQYQQNGFFHVSILKAAAEKPAPSRVRDDDDEDDVPVKKPAKTVAQVASKKSGHGLKKRT